MLESIIYRYICTYMHLRVGIQRTTHHAPRTTHHAPRTTHHAPRTTHHAPALLGSGGMQLVCTHMHLFGYACMLYAQTLTALFGVSCICVCKSYTMNVCVNSHKTRIDINIQVTCILVLTFSRYLFFIRETLVYMHIVRMHNIWHYVLYTHTHIYTYTHESIFLWYA